MQGRHQSLNAPLPAANPLQGREPARGLRSLLILFPLIGLPAGLAAGFLGNEPLSRLIWASCTVPVLGALVWDIITSLRRGDIGLDIVAALSMTAALVFGEHLAAAVVALMYAGGQYLEHFAERRARRDMTALLARVPRFATRHRDGTLEEVALDDIRPGDVLLVRRGDVVPVDGTVHAGTASLDRSALTGEPMPVRHGLGETVMSGVTNAGEAFALKADRPAAESTYAGIVRLVEAAQRVRAPMARLADRFAIAFLFVTVSIAGAAWLATDDPVRAVAVLVVATPCPLILAVPVAIVAGLSRAAKQGILVKGGQALETMARVRTLVIDKTGTLTDGRARIVAIHPAPGWNPAEALRLAAAADQGSRHIIAQTIVAAAKAEGHVLPVPTAVRETPGEGIEAQVEGHAVLVGGRAFVFRHLGEAGPGPMLARDADGPGAVVSALAVDGRLAAEFVLADTLRPGVAALLRQLRQRGVGRIVLASGDRRTVAEAIGEGLGLDAVHADLTPEQKVRLVLAEQKNGPVMMVGDGVNDAPALAAANLGIAMGARGAAASAEAADVVLLVDQLERILPGIDIARRSRRIALESVGAGIGLSVIGMIAAAFGEITPLQGALIQEAIDVAVILNALRALHGPSA